MPDTNFEAIWKRIVENAVERFFTKTGKPFTYKIAKNMFIPSRTEYAISKGDVRKAYEQMPISGPGQISQIVRGPSYLWAVLNDERITGGEW